MDHGAALTALGDRIYNRDEVSTARYEPNVYVQFRFHTHVALTRTIRRSLTAFQKATLFLKSENKGQTSTIPENFRDQSARFYTLKPQSKL